GGKVALDIASRSHPAKYHCKHLAPQYFILLRALLMSVRPVSSVTVAHSVPSRRFLFQAPNRCQAGMREQRHFTKPLKLLAGAPGFEPGDGGIKIRCLTAWLRPNPHERGELKARGP